MERWVPRVPALLGRSAARSVHACNGRSMVSNQKKLCSFAPRADSNPRTHEPSTVDGGSGWRKGDARASNKYKYIPQIIRKKKKSGPLPERDLPEVEA